jgi:mRNA-degrading endonuclease RelE of RelBE toxin-antitoxin system
MSVATSNANKPLALARSAMDRAIETEIKLAFESKAIGEVRALERRTREQVEAKKQELRALVATRYRDLIESADSIVRMHTASSSLLSNVDK